MLRLKKLNLACVAIQACNEPIQSISHLAWNTVRPKGAVITLNSNIMEALGCLFPADKLHPQRSSPITCRSTGEADNAEIIRLRGLLGRLKSEHQNLMQLRVRLVKKNKNANRFTRISENKLTTGFWRLFLPRAWWTHKKTKNTCSQSRSCLFSQL